MPTLRDHLLGDDRQRVVVFATVLGATAVILFVAFLSWQYGMPLRKKAGTMLSAVLQRVRGQPSAPLESPCDTPQASQSL